MKHQSISTVALSALLLVLSSCGGSDGSSGKLPADTKVLNQCIPEDKLMARNIIGGQKVGTWESDSKKVVMILSNYELCTASAIAPNVLLTAAHCINGAGDNIEVVYHTSVSCESGYSPNSHRSISADAVIHPGYSAIAGLSTSDNDVALVFLRESVPYGYKIHKIADPDQVDTSSSILFLGYGRIESDRDGAVSGSGILRRITMSRDDFSISKSTKKVEITQSSGKGICSGDSGGPSLVKVNGEEQILGVNSFVMGPERDICQGRAYLELADSYKSWIQNEMIKRGYTPIQ